MANRRAPTNRFVRVGSSGLYGLMGCMGAMGWLAGTVPIAAALPVSPSDPQAIAKAQVRLVEALALAATSQDGEFLRATRNRLILHLSDVERLLRRHPATPCPRSEDRESSQLVALTQLAAGASSDLEARCALQATRPALARALALLDLRARVLQRDVEMLPPVPLVTGTEPPFDPFRQWYWHPGHRLDERYRAALRLESRPSLDREPGTTFEPAKTPIARTDPAYPPTLPPSTRRGDFLDRGQAIVASSPLQPEPYVPRNPLHTYDEALDFAAYKDFLTRVPGTGLARLSPPAALSPRNLLIDNTNPYRTDPADLGAARPPHAEAEPRESPLMLMLDGSDLVATNALPDTLDYGFVREVGDVSLEALGTAADPVPEAIAADVWRYFWDYRPPSTVAALQTARRQFRKGTDDLNLRDRAPLHLDRTYLLRAIAYDIPATATNPRLELSRRFPYLAIPNSSDLLIAFRPIRERDGSYTLLWRILHRFPSPQIDDLTDYARTR